MPSTGTFTTAPWAATVRRPTTQAAARAVRAVTDPTMNGDHHMTTMTITGPEATTTPQHAEAQSPAAAALAAITATREALNQRFINRDKDIHAVLIALIAQANITLVGEPGTAKSALVRALGQSLSGATWFEHQVAADTPRQAVIGGYDMAAMDRGEFRLDPTGMLPEAHLALLDEGYRANSVLLDALLGLANPTERVLHNGRQVTRVPLWCLVITCNQLPDPGDEHLEAFRDRMILTRHVEPATSDRDRLAILTGQLAGHTAAPLPDLKATHITYLQDQVPQVVASQEFTQAMLEMWRALEGEGIGLSARKAGQIMRLAQAAAVLEGRVSLGRGDVLVARDTLWATLDDQPVIDQLLEPFQDRTALLITGYQARLRDLTEAADGVIRDLPKDPGINQRGFDVAGELRVLLENLAMEPQHPALTEIATRATTLQRGLVSTLMGTAGAHDDPLF